MKDDSWESVCFPDYSLEVYYEGRTITADEEAFVNVTVDRGSDIQEVRVGMLNTVDGSDITYYIQNNFIESELVPASGKVQLPFTPENNSDKYTIVAIGYADGQAVATALTRFLYNPAIDSEGWTMVGYGEYEYTVFWTGTDPKLYLYQSNEDANVYKIAPWGENTDLAFNWNKEDGTVVVYDQPINVEYGDYGMVYVGDMEKEESPSKFEDDVFYFNVAYYVEAGILGMDYETFTVNAWNEPAEAKARANNFVPQTSNKLLKSGLKPSKTKKLSFHGVEVIK